MTPEILFSPAPENLVLANGEVHIFCAVLDVSVERLEQLAETLSEDERERASRFIFERDRNRFVAGRGMLREILGWLLCRKPGGLLFSYGFHGKPRLAMAAWGNFLHFNLAHSDSLAVYAVSRESEIGIDVERIRPVREAEEIAARFFPEPERARWCSLPSEKKAAAFFNCWTRNEAMLKADGEGIGVPQNQMKVFAKGDLFDTAHYSQRSLTPALNYTATVAVKRRTARVNCWKWQKESSDIKMGSSQYTAMMADKPD